MTDHDEDYALLVPFVVCSDHGGPFDPDAFAAGWEMGVLWQRCRLLEAMEVPAIMATIRSANLPQADLIAMHYNRHCAQIVEAERLAITSDGWTPILISVDKPGDESER